MELENADGQHKRDLENMAIERQYHLENEKSRDEKEKGEQVRNLQLEQERYQRVTQEKQAEHQRQLALIQELAELKPELVAYLDSIRKIAESENKDPDYEKLRHDYRAELVDKWHDGSDDIFDTDLDDIQEQINNLVDLKYPPKQANVPNLSVELERLIRLITE